MSLTFTPVGDPPVPGGPGAWEIPKWRWPQSVAADGTFRVEGLTPSIYRIEARGPGWLGEAVVDAAEGDATTVVAVARAGIVKISVPATSAAATAQVVGSLNDGPWHSIVNMGTYPDHPFSATQTMPAGRLRWRAVLRRTPSPSDPFDLAEPQQGEVNVEDGKEVEITLSVAPRK